MNASVEVLPVGPPSTRQHKCLGSGVDDHADGVGPFLSSGCGSLVCNKGTAVWRAVSRVTLAAGAGDTNKSLATDRGPAEPESSAEQEHPAQSS